MEHKIIIRFIRTSPKKLRFIADDVKKMTPIQALQVLKYDSRKSSSILYKAIKAAVASSKSALNIDENLLKFRILEISEGPILKRSRAGGRGTAKLFKKRSSHIQVVLSGESIQVQPDATVKSKETKPLQLAANTQKVEKKTEVKNSTKESAPKKVKKQIIKKATK